MKKIILFFIVIILSVDGFSQPAIQWQKCYGGTVDDEGGGICKTQDGGYVVNGYAYSNNGDVSGSHGDLDYWVVKLDNSGSIQWQKCYGGTDIDWGYSVIQSGDGGFILYGISRSNDGDVTGHHGSNSIFDGWIVKIDSAANIQWQKSLGGTESDNPSSIQLTNDGGYMIAGSSSSNDGDVTGHHGSALTSDVWVVKLDGAGNIQWQKSLGGTANDHPSSILQTNDGGYILSGATSSNDGDVSGNHGGQSDCWVAKLNSAGNIQWQKCLGGTGSDGAGTIKQTSDGGFIVVGSSTSNDGDLTNNNGGTDLWVVKLDTTGAIQWQKTYGGTGYESGGIVEQTLQGYTILGGTNSNDVDVSGNHGGADYWIIKIDGIGNLQWQKCLGGSGYEAWGGMLQTIDGGFIMSGLTASNDSDVTGNHGIEDYWIVKLFPDDVGILENNFSYLNIFPNPATNELRIESRVLGTELKIKEIEIYSSLGEKRLTLNPSPKERDFRLDVSFLPSGIYFITVTDQAGNKVTGKVVKM